MCRLHAARESNRTVRRGHVRAVTGPPRARVRGFGDGQFPLDAAPLRTQLFCFSAKEIFQDKTVSRGSESVASRLSHEPYVTRGEVVPQEQRGSSQRANSSPVLPSTGSERNYSQPARSHGAAGRPPPPKRPSSLQSPLLRARHPERTALTVTAARARAASGLPRSGFPSEHFIEAISWELGPRVTVPASPTMTLRPGDVQRQ